MTHLPAYGGDTRMLQARRPSRLAGPLVRSVDSVVISAFAEASADKRNDLWPSVRYEIVEEASSRPSHGTMYG